MSPEYALESLFSIKLDVFSFGVLMLEIASGRKNTRFYQTNYFHLLGYVSILFTTFFFFFGEQKFNLPLRALVKAI